MQIARGKEFSTAIRDDGQVEIQGKPFRHHKLEYLRPRSYKSDPRPLKERAIAIATGQNHIVVLLESGKVKAWGENTAGQCKISGLKGVKAIDAGGMTSTAILEDGTYRKFGGWGISVEPDLPRCVQVATGDSHSLVLSEDNEIVGSAGGIYPPLLKDRVMQIVSGDHHALALTETGKVVQWGHYTNEPLGALPRIIKESNIVEVWAGGDVSGGRLDNGEIIVWGAHFPRGIKIDQGNRYVSQLAFSGHSKILILLEDGTVFGDGWRSAEKFSSPKTGLIKSSRKR